MTDPTSDLCEDVDPEDAPECAACGDPIVENPDHVVETWVEDGSVESLHFCDPDCKAEY